MCGEVFSIDWLITFFTEKNKEKRTTKELKKTNNNNTNNRPKEQPRFWNRPHNKQNQQPVWNEYNRSESIRLLELNTRTVGFTDCSHQLHLSNWTTLLYYTVCWTISQRPLNVFRRSERGIGRVREGQGREKDFDFFQPFFSFDFILSPPIPFSTMIKPTGMRRGSRFDIN